MQFRVKPKTRPKRSAKTWWPKLFDKERFVVDSRYFKTRDALLEVKKEPVDAALEEFESSVPSWDISVVRKLMKPEALSDSVQRSSARARLDDRDHTSGRRRPYSQWLDAIGLHQALNAERFDSVDHPEMNADRRLIYIYDLSAEYIIALVKTASYNQMPALRDALCKHVEAQTSIRICIPVDGLKTFQLDFHVPFPTLRCAHKGFSSESTNGAKPWFDLDFLELECDKEGKVCSWNLYESNVSVVVWGWDRYRWVGWAFSNTLSNPATRDEEEAEMEEDYFATDANGPPDGRVIDADQPFWDPREYWLRIVNNRMHLIYKEWEWIVKNVAQRIRAWIREQDIVLAKKFKNRGDQDKVFDWIIQSMRLLRRLNEKHAAIMHVWNRFSACEGHIKYLSDIRNKNINRLRDTLRETFEGLADLGLELESLQKEIEVTNATLTIVMERENNCMAHENNRMALQNREITVETNQLSLEMAEVNRDVLQFTRTSTDAAVETVRSTRTNIHLFVITTPFVLALQYFGAEKDIFAFDRNPKTFTIALCILFCVLPILTYILNMINHGWKGLWEKLKELWEKLKDRCEKLKELLVNLHPGKVRTAKQPQVPV